MLRCTTPGAPPCARTLSEGLSLPAAPWRAARREAEVRRRWRTPMVERPAALGRAAPPCCSPALRSFDDLVCAHEHRRRDRQTKRLSGLDVDHGLETLGPLDWKLPRIGPPQNTIDVACRPCDLLIENR